LLRRFEGLLRRFVGFSRIVFRFIRCKVQVDCD
jgi:hypothetical protein